MLLLATLTVLLQAAPAPAAPMAEAPRRLVFANRYSLQWSIVAPAPSGEVGLFLGSSLRPRLDRRGRPWKTALGYEFAINVGGADRGTAFFSWGGNYGLVYHHHHVAALGYGLGDSIPDNGLHMQAFAAGAVLVMLADSMMPEAFRHGGKSVGLLTVLGFLAAAVLSITG